MTQEKALEILKSGKNVFLTGGAGSGKTYTINKFVEDLKSKGIYPDITASTGIAATHLNGTTIHSWSGMAIKDKFSDLDIQNILNKTWVMKKITSCSVLIIDEVSMLDATFIDNLDRILSIARDGITRDVNKPFGGIQIVFVGDFFQLPPVSKDRATLFAFESEAWKRSSLEVCYITEQHRQDDHVYLDILNSLREGRLTKDHVEILRSRDIKPDKDNTITQLFTHNVDVDRVNEAALKMIDSKEFVFEMESSGNEYLVETLKKSCLSPNTLKLKVGAIVMFTKNNFDQDTGEAHFVNGTVGEVVQISGNLIKIKLKNGKIVILDEKSKWCIEERKQEIAAIYQYPIRLAYAITIHKSQGMTLDSAIMDLSKSFEFGQGYVALSRVKSLDGLYLEGFNGHSLKMHPKVIEMDKVFKN